MGAASRIPAPCRGTRVTWCPSFFFCTAQRSGVAPQKEWGPHPPARPFVPRLPSHFPCDRRPRNPENRVAATQPPRFACERIPSTALSAHFALPSSSARFVESLASTGTTRDPRSATAQPWTTRESLAGTAAIAPENLRLDGICDLYLPILSWIDVCDGRDAPAATHSWADSRG